MPGVGGPWRLGRHVARSCSRRNSTGSARVIGSTMTKPGGHEHRPPAREPIERTVSTEDERHADHERNDAEHDLARRRAAATGATTPPDDEEPGQRERTEEERGRDAQREPLLVAVRERVGRGRRDVVSRRERAATRPWPRPRRRSRASTVLRRSSRSDRERRRMRARSIRNAVRARRTGRERREEADAPREPEQGRGRDAWRVGPRRRLRPAAGPAVTGSVIHATREQPQEETGRGRVTPFTCARRPLGACASGDRRVPSPCRRPSGPRCSFPESRRASAACPHDDPVAAAELVLRCLPDLPAAPQLPVARRSRRDAGAVAGCAPRGRGRARRRRRRRNDSDARARVRLRRPAHAGLLDVPRRRRRAREATGPGQGAGHRSRSRSASRCRPRESQDRARSGAPPRSRAPGRSRSRSW